MMKGRGMALAIALLFGIAAPMGVGARADALLELNWDKLIPFAPPLKNPLEDAPAEQLEALDAIEYWRSFPNRPLGAELEADRDQAKQDADAWRSKLAGQGVDVDALYEAYDKWLREIDQRGRLTERAYDKKRVSIAGYLLPLDFDPGGSSEFLLVPYIGACIHVPPPPPNQVLYVRTAKPHRMPELFEAVQVSGEMRVEPVTKDLSFIDGASTVEASYSLVADRVEPYDDSGAGQ
jgi:hypothetical protein